MQPSFFPLTTTTFAHSLTMPQSNHHHFHPQNIPCTFNGCSQLFSDQSGLKQHVKCTHPTFTGIRAYPQRQPPPTTVPSLLGTPHLSGSQSLPPHDDGAGDNIPGSSNVLDSNRDGQAGGKPLTTSAHSGHAHVKFHPLLNGMYIQVSLNLQPFIQTLSLRQHVTATRTVTFSWMMHPCLPPMPVLALTLAHLNHAFSLKSPTFSIIVCRCLQRRSMN